MRRPGQQKLPATTTARGQDETAAAVPAKRLKCEGTSIGDLFCDDKKSLRHEINQIPIKARKGYMANFGCRWRHLGVLFERHAKHSGGRRIHRPQ